ncbi:MAG: hypothetical protein LQ340_007618 [Diploschistes diacapsis]|nr:MAG: hypothetical protein LQ340_007618 [Diploschistes diacapsis]
MLAASYIVLFIEGSDLHFILQNGKKNNNLHGTVKNLLQTYGNGKTMQVLTWSIPTIISSDHRLIQAVLTTNFDNFGVEPVRMAFNKPWIGGGIVMSDGPSVTQCPEALVPQGAYVDIAIDFLFADSALSLSLQPRMDVDTFLTAMEKALEGVQQRVLLGPLAKYLPPSRAWLQACGTVHELFDRQIDIALAQQDEKDRADLSPDIRRRTLQRAR